MSDAKTRGLGAADAVVRRVTLTYSGLGAAHGGFIGQRNPRTYWTNLGRYFGYPDCCIKAFVDEDLPPFPGPFDGTGYRPCRACEALPRDRVLEGIARRRQHHEPFPVSAGLTEAVRRSFYGD